jgi:hypothetical protein
MGEETPNLISVSVRWCCRLHGVMGPGHCISCRKRFGGHSMRFQAVFKETPSEREIADVQIAKGYHPAGYGAPNRLTTIGKPEGWCVTWYCSDNCE